MRGKPPHFFDGNESFIGLFFDLDREEAHPKKTRSTLDISLSDLYKGGASRYRNAIKAHYADRQDVAAFYLERLDRLYDIRNMSLHVETVSHRTAEEVVEIFHHRNTAGRSLKPPEVAMAWLSHTHPQARNRIPDIIQSWEDHYRASLPVDRMLECLAVLLADSMDYSQLHKVERDAFDNGLDQVVRHMDRVWDMLATRLGLDHGEVISNTPFPLLVFAMQTLQDDHRDFDLLLHWYLRTATFQASSRNTMPRYLGAMRHNVQNATAVDHLVGEMELKHGDTPVGANLFQTFGMGPKIILYWLTRTAGAHNWESGEPLNRKYSPSPLKPVHIFNSKLLKSFGPHPSSSLGSAANRVYLPQEWTDPGDPPAIHLSRLEDQHPGILASHWIPVEPRLWRPENFLEFLEERKKALARDCNLHLDALRNGQAPR